MKSEPTIPDWLRTMPKVELHVHLEGTMTPAYLWTLVQRHDLEIGVTSEADAAALFTYQDFPHFIETFTICSDCLKTAEDLGGLVSAYGEELARQNVRYAEIHFNPEPHFRRKGIPFPELLATMNDARDGVARDYGIEMRWIVDGVRDAVIGPASADISVGWMIESGHDSGIVALGLGGNEIGRPPAPFAAAFSRARDAGFHVVAHAGEALGPESIRDTLDQLGAERIGHGVAAARDEALMERLARAGIPLEISPTSNLRTGVIDSLEDLPLQVFRDHGVRFSINSDDPPMFGTTVLRENALVTSLLEMGRRHMAMLVSDSIDQSFAPDSIKDRLQRQLRDHTPLD